MQEILFSIYNVKNTYDDDENGNGNILEIMLHVVIVHLWCAGYLEQKINKQLVEPLL